MPELPLQHHSKIMRLHARWPAWVALIVVGFLYEALPSALYWGSHGVMISLMVLLIVPMIISFWKENARLNYLLALSVNSLITFYMIISVVRIVYVVVQNNIEPVSLLYSSMMLWVTNILVFALWYWNLDAGGPHQREAKDSSHVNAFLFPQNQISLALEDQNLPCSIRNWRANFIDYLFLSFNTSTAFSPTDTPVITRWAKFMCMMQALVSLTIVVMLAARAINIIHS